MSHGEMKAYQMTKKGFCARVNIASADSLLPSVTCESLIFQDTLNLISQVDL